MTNYSQERKDAILKFLLPPYNMTISAVAKQENISTKNIYNWRRKAEAAGKPVPGNKTLAEDWSVETKLSVIIETATLTEAELSQYCREKGLYVEQVKRWKQEFLAGFLGDKQHQKDLLKQAKVDKLQIKELKKDLKYKEKALAETAALLVLRKKLNTLWQDESEDS